MSTDIRKVYVAHEAHYRDGGKEIPNGPWRTCVVAAVVKNPWFGQGYVEDLDPGVREWAPRLGGLIIPRLLDELGGPDEVEAYGKAALGGDGGSVEHAAALIQTLRFGDLLRDLAGGQTYMSSTCKRGGVGGVLTVPMTHKNDGRFRGHNLTQNVVIPDSPRSDEILVAVGGAIGPRPFYRQTGDYSA